MTTYLITGGAGFIGSNFIRYILKKYPEINPVRGRPAEGTATTALGQSASNGVKVINLDKLTYSGNLDNLKDIEKDPRYSFIKGDITDRDTVEDVFAKHSPDITINFAAETHVDRSINQPDDFIRTDVYGTFTLLEVARLKGIQLHVQISTDEIYGYIPKGSATEEYPLMPTNPYSASKAGADRLCYSYYTTYKMPVIITRASNNFGPFQYPEKIMPLFITNALEDKSLPIYGDGLQIRDWLYVLDHCDALNFLINNGKAGEVYNIGGGNLLTNLKLTKLILSYLKKPESLIKYVKDRPGHDRRYSLNTVKLEKLGWSPKTDFEKIFINTIEWYKTHKEWWQKIKSGEFKEYYKKQYISR